MTAARWIIAITRLWCCHTPGQNFLGEGVAKFGEVPPKGAWIKPSLGVKPPLLPLNLLPDSFYFIHLTNSHIWSKTIVALSYKAQHATHFTFHLVPPIASGLVSSCQSALRSTLSKAALRSTYAAHSGWLNSLLVWCNMLRVAILSMVDLSLIHIWRCRRIERCRSRWSPYH